MAHTTRQSDLFHLVIGQGPPLLLMHGGLGLDHTVFRPSLDPLADDFTLIYYDHRGNGRSPRPDDFSQLTHATWADDADELRQALGFEKWIVLGESYGGVLALEYVLRYGEHVQGLVLCSTTPAYDYADVAFERVKVRGTSEQVDVLQRTMSGPVPDDQALEEAVHIVMPMYVYQGTETLMDRLFGDVRFCASAFNRAFLELLPEYDVRARLSEITAPTLAVSGQHDWLCPPENGVAPFTGAMRDARAAVFERSGHFPFAEEAEPFRQTLLEWARTITHSSR